MSAGMYKLLCVRPIYPHEISNTVPSKKTETMVPSVFHRLNGNRFPWFPRGPIEVQYR